METMWRSPDMLKSNCENIKTKEESVLSQEESSVWAVAESEHFEQNLSSDSSSAKENEVRKI